MFSTRKINTRKYNILITTFIGNYLSICVGYKPYLQPTVVLQSKIHTFYRWTRNEMRYKKCNHIIKKYIKKKIRQLAKKLTVTKQNMKLFTYHKRYVGEAATLVTKFTIQWRWTKPILVLDIQFRPLYNSSQYFFVSNVTCPDHCLFVDTGYSLQMEISLPVL